MGDNDSNDKKNANRHSLNAIKGGFVKDMVNRGFRKKINDSDKNDDSKEDKGGQKPSNVSKDSSSMKAGNVAALRDQFRRAAEKDESKDQNEQAGQSSLTSKAPLGDPRTDQRARAKFLAEKYEKILAARNMVEESASRALQRPATSTPAKIPASVSGVSKEPKDTSEQPRPSKAEPRPSTTPSTSLGPQEPKDTSEQPRPSKAEPRPSTTPSTSLGPQEPKDTSEQPRPSKAEPRPSTTPSTSLGPQEPKDTSEQPRPSKAEPRPSTTPSTSLGPQEPKDTSEQPRPSKAEPRPSTTPSTSLGPQEPKDTSEQPRPSKAEPRPSTTPSTSLGPQEPKDTSEQPRPSKAEPRPSTTPSTSLGPQEPKDTSEQPRPSKAEPRPSTTPSTSLGPQEPKDTSEQPRSSKAESKLSTTLSKLRFSRESRSVIKGTGSFGGSSQVSSNAGRRVHTLADTASTDDASIRQAMSQSFSSPGVSQPEQPERASRGRNMFGMRRRPCWIRIQVKEKIFPGKMVLAISTTILIIVVFMFELFINRATFNGRCIGEVDYTHRHEGKAILSYLGYVGCENNLKTTAAERGFLGAGASDKGYPVDYVHKGNLATSLAPPDGPNYRIGTIVGALSANTIRIYGESSRLLTSIFLHGGRWHLLCNCLMNMLLLYVIEPDWGFKRTLALYIFGGYSANLVHASMSPCIPCWGASGSLFSLYGAFIPYTVEHWDNLRSPMALIVIAITISLLEIILPGVGVSNHAHLGGFAFGLCFGFATLKSVSAFDRGALWSRIALRFSSRLSPEAVQKHQAKVVKSAQSEEILRIKYEQGAKDSANRLRFVKRMFGIYPYGPYRMRLRDVLTRAVFLCALIAMFVFFYLATFYESVYKNIDRNATILFSRACHCGYFKSSGDELLLNQIGNLAGKFYCFDSESARDKFCAVSG